MKLRLIAVASAATALTVPATASAATLEIVAEDRLLEGLLKSRPGSRMYYNLGRLVRKSRFYPSPYGKTS